jgi:uncharacterized cupredoxin-like copper-binding protein
MKYRNNRLALGVIFALFVMVLSACGGTRGSSTSSGSQQVQVNETDFKIASSVTIFTPGRSYHFIVTNNGHTVHEFMIMPSTMGSMSGTSMEDMDKMALAKLNNIAAGQIKTLDYTFPSSTAGSHPQFACYYPGYYAAGMKLDVSVNQ